MHIQVMGARIEFQPPFHCIFFYIIIFCVVHRLQLSKIFFFTYQTDNGNKNLNVLSPTELMCIMSILMLKTNYN